MEKIKMQTPLVEMDGDEMTRILWQIIKDELLTPYLELCNENTELDELMNEKKTYETVIQKYIETNVFEEDRNKMLVATDFNNICKQLQLVSQFTIHYRIKNGNDILRYRMKCARIGNADTFEKIVFAFASEDSDIRLDELGIMNLSSTGEKRKSIFSLLIK